MKWLLYVVLICITSLIHAQEVEKPAGNKADTALTKKSSPKKSYITGVASYYSKSLEGSPTSSGERFTHSKYTCASNHVKLGTWIRVTNTANGKSVIVKVNDRMHPRMAKKGRVVDLTITAFSAIGNTNSGLLKVKVEVLGKNKPKNA
jgi:rare lipoprotein A